MHLTLLILALCFTFSLSLPSFSNQPHRPHRHIHTLAVRGGSTEEYESEEVEVVPKKKKTSKTKKTKKISSKSVFTAPISTSTAPSITKRFLAVVSLFSPATLVFMCKTYWITLFNPTYSPVENDTGQQLRSALERKRQMSPGSPRKGQRKMKRGQAKTLSDLPKLSA